MQTESEEPVVRYISKVEERYKKGISTEHSYRADLQFLLEAILPDCSVTNEPKRIACGAPDFIVTRNNISVGYLEAKDVGKDLNSKEFDEQFSRYKDSLQNLIITDYLTFQLFVSGEMVDSVSIASINKKLFQKNSENYKRLQLMLKDFGAYRGQTIRSSKKLAQMMASKARMLALVIEQSINSDQQSKENSTLRDQLEAFKSFLIHDISPKEFADIYSQSIAYGMFAARLHDPSLETFSRQEAAELIPKTNPFLRKLFQYNAGYDVDSRIVWIVDSLAEIFASTDVNMLLADFGGDNVQKNPIVHFYETFLAEYDPKLRKARGVWYTPEPVVAFIVRALNDTLKHDFKLSEGLACTDKTVITVDTQASDRRTKSGYSKSEREVHRVQILDPAAGTGTFLYEVIRNIYSNFQGQKGIWSSYVEKDLIPRLHGFEILMASYSMAHLSLDLLLRKTQYTPNNEKRFRVYLTNSLEEHHPDTGTLFASWLSDEANEANHVKRDTPVMVVVGNPPYSVSSSNKSNWIESLMKTYKSGLNEQNIQPLSDDYIKFIRFAQHCIAKNGDGILGFITNNSYLDGIVHRTMRKELLKTFDKIFILNLHGNSRLKEVAPDGSKDENVFDIMQGVAIGIFVKDGTSKSNAYASVKYCDVWGKRSNKYKFLEENSLSTIDFVDLAPQAPNYYFYNRDRSSESEYSKGFKISDLFDQFSNGFTSERDQAAIHFSRNELANTLDDLKSISEEEFRAKHSLKKDGSEWKIATAREDVMKGDGEIVTALYRPFDYRYTYFTGRSKGFMARPRGKVLKHLLHDNLALILPRQTKDKFGCFISNTIAGHKAFAAYDKNTVFPLYLYEESDSSTQLTLNSAQPRANFKGSEFERICRSAGSALKNEDLLDYIYAILNSPLYFEKFGDLLVRDFPRVPYPTSSDCFQEIATAGSMLRRLHLMDPELCSPFITQYPVDGDNRITKKINKTDWRVSAKGNQIGRIMINNDQFFDSIPCRVWDEFIGGFQPARKWLKDRFGRTLSYEEIMHYQRIIVAMDKSLETLNKIDELVERHFG